MQNCIISHQPEKIKPRQRSRRMIEEFISKVLQEAKPSVDSRRQNASHPGMFSTFWEQPSRCTLNLSHCLFDVYNISHTVQGVPEKTIRF